LAGAAAAWPVLFAGVIGAGVPTLCFITGIRLLGAPRAAILATLEPVVGVGLAALLLREEPAVLQIVGGLLIIGAGVLLQLRSPASSRNTRRFQPTWRRASGWGDLSGDGREDTW